MDETRGWTQPAEAGGDRVDFDLLPATKGGRRTRVCVEHDVRPDHAQAQGLSSTDDDGGNLGIAGSSVINEYAFTCADPPSSLI